MKPQDNLVPEERTDAVTKRKVYEKPELLVYGDLAEITQNVNLNFNADGTGHPNKHFTS